MHLQPLGLRLREPTVQCMRHGLPGEHAILARGMVHGVAPSRAPSSPDSAGRTLSNFTRAWNSRALTVPRSEEHTSELQSLMRISYAVFCFKNTIITLMH